jgi:adenine-specific DNA-methyltransferase
MRYIGSKVSTIESVYSLIAERVPTGSFCDPFGGIGIVGSYFKQHGYQVWSGDLLTFAHYFQIAQIAADTETLFSRLKAYLNVVDLNEISNYLNALFLTDGWLVQEYAEKRRFFTLENAKKIEACRQTIILWRHENYIDETEYAILIASLINSFDRVANTAGTYYAYLKKWYRKAIQPFRFELLASIPGNRSSQAMLTDAKSLVRLRFFDILYLDPPYNDRNYADYYHLPETIARGVTPALHGLSGIPNEVRPKSDFNKPATAKQALIDILDNARFRLLAFHYSDNGLIPSGDVVNILQSYGRVEEFSLCSKGYSTARTNRTVSHHLYLVTHA